MRLTREEIFGTDGGPQEVADRLDLPLRTWLNYERGVSIPAEVMLSYLILTGTEPLWMFTGEGARYRPPSSGR